MTLLSLSLIFFLIMDPLGNASYFLDIVRPISEKRQLWVILREMLIALFIMCFFWLIGDDILRILEVNDATVSLTAGLVLFLVSLKILYPKPNESRVTYRPESEPFIVPLALPMIAGPGLLATIMLFSKLYGEIVLPAIVYAWLVAAIFLLSSRFLVRVLGKAGLVACERLMGMVLVLLAIQRIVEGIQLFVKTVNG